MKKFLMSWGSVVVFVLGVVISLLLYALGVRDYWSTPLILAIAVLLVMGTVSDLSLRFENPGYKINRSSRNLNIDEKYKKILIIKCDDTIVGIENVIGSKLYVYVRSEKSNYILTDGNLENILETEAGNLCVTRQNSGYQVSWTEGVWGVVR